MSYLSFIEDNKQAFIERGVLAKASDAAKILDEPLFRNESGLSIVDVGNYLKHLCGLCNLAHPEHLFELTDGRMVFMPRIMPFDPEKATRVLIVDDELPVMIDTARAFIGWPNLQMAYYYFEAGSDKEKDIQRALNEIAKINSDIVLMDQDLDGVKGYELVREFKRIKSTIIFVGNTDAEDHTLMLDAGCLPNCGKGNFPEGLRQALKLFKMRNF